MLQSANRASPRIGGQASSWLILSSLLASSGCSGLLLIDEPGQACTTSAECGLSAVCNTETGRCMESPGPCSASVPDGDCPVGFVCDTGICICADPEECECGGSECLPSWCDCAPSEGCRPDGTCEGVTQGTNDCTEDRPDGLCEGGGSCCDGECCPDGEICVSGGCMPNSRPCSASEPNGFCGDGLSCRDGRCLPTAQSPCTPQNPVGLCGDGEICQGGTCVDVPCSATSAGSCPEDYACESTGCVQMPCSPEHDEGHCDGTDFCSAVGQCIDEDTCLVNEDCDDSGLYCSATLACLDRGGGVCAVDEDCEDDDKLGDTFGQGHACVSSACVERSTCTVDEDCVEEKYCSSGGNCLEPDECDGDPDCPDDHYCSAGGTCIKDGECGVDLDCLPLGSDKFCASNDHCIDKGQCVGPVDCPPSHTCDMSGGGELGVCEVDGTLCQGDWTTSGCAANELFCCPTGSGTCCMSPNQFCSAAGNCIEEGQCVDASDCPTGFACESYRCVPETAEPCEQCVSNEVCLTVTNAQGGTETTCVAPGTCIDDDDCLDGEQCNAQHVCEPAANCGVEFLNVGALIPPNVMVVLDRSGSMQLCGAGEPLAGFCGFPEALTACASASDCDPGVPCHDFGGALGMKCACNAGQDGSTTTRWEQAVSAISQITSEYQGRINFGMSIYPQQASDTADPSDQDSCAVQCNWYTCKGGTNLQGGDIDVPVAPGTRTAILDELNATAPGGSTPTAPTLRSILSLSDLGGLNAADRANAVLLVTDGEATGDTATIKVCQPACSDGTKNGNETDVDCGGSCLACAVGDACEVADDCDSRVCRGGVCLPATCADETKNGDETGTDCGGSCEACDEGAACVTNADCRSGKCQSSRCQASSCSDGIKNGSETAVDCGGSCTTDCADGAACLVGADCVHGVCQAGTCRPAACGNGSFDAGTETDVDCGGSCGPCAEGDDCGVDGDCATASCDTNTCVKPLCADGVLNNGETDVDCGGSCAPCGPGRACAGDTDCDGGTCLDCGGATAPQACRVNAAIDGLYAQDPRIKTFVVGFAFSGVSTNLNCHAVHGRSARGDVTGCDQLTTADCDQASAACYYDASDETSLSGAFDSILTQVSSCSYVMTLLPPDSSRMFVYLEEVGSSPPVRHRIDRYVSWNYVAGQIDIQGTACEQVKSGAVAPIVILGCPIVGG